MSKNKSVVVNKFILITILCMAAIMLPLISMMQPEETTTVATAASDAVTRTNNNVSSEVEIAALKDTVNVKKDVNGEITSSAAEGGQYAEDADGVKYYYTGMGFTSEYDDTGTTYDYIAKASKTIMKPTGDTSPKDGVNYYKIQKKDIVTDEDKDTIVLYYVDAGNNVYQPATEYNPSMVYYERILAGATDTSSPEGMALLYVESVTQYVDTTKLYSISSKAELLNKYGSLMMANMTSENCIDSRHFSVHLSNDSSIGDIIIRENPGDVEFIMTYAFSEELKCLLKDNLLVVTATPYIRTKPLEGIVDSDLQNQFITSRPNVNINLDYYNETTQKITTGGTRLLPIVPGDGIYEGTDVRLASNVYGDKSFMQVRLSNWGSTGDGFGMLISEMGVKIKVTPNRSVVINKEEGGSKFEIISKKDDEGNDYRHDEAEWNIAKIGDTINMNLVFSSGGTNIALDKTPYKDISEITVDDVTNGTMFRQVFLDTSQQVSNEEGKTAEDEFIVTWEIQKGEAEIIIDENNKSGQDISFTIVGSDFLYDTSDVRGILLVAKIAYRKINTAKESFSTNIFEIIVDTDAPNSPRLNGNTFYTKYILNRVFYTNSAAQSKYNAENTIPIQLNIASGMETNDTKPYFSDEAFDLKGGSSQVIYYKTKYIGDTIPSAPSDKVVTANTAFNPDDVVGDYEEIGEYCRVIDRGGGNAIVDFSNNEMFINLADKNGENAKSFGVWSIEFVVYDYVGQKSFSTIKYFLRVDITDYEIKTRYYLGNLLGGIGSSQVLIRYATLSDQGKLSSWQIGSEFMQLRRGDKVKVEVKFNSSSYANRYVLSRFETQGVDWDCIKDCTWSSNSTYIESMTYRNSTSAVVQKYTFEVGEAFCIDEKNRFLTFRFKNKVSLRVTGKEQIYSGAGKSVIAQAVDNEDEVIGGVKVESTYYLDAAKTIRVSVGDNESNIPVDAGTYYYYAEITNNVSYYGNDEGTLVIKQATPNISSLWTSISMEYGESMASLDFDYSLPRYKVLEGGVIEVQERQKENSEIMALYGEKYMSSISTDGVPGYYAINVTDHESETYTRPKAGTQIIEIKFIAVKASVIGGDEGDITVDYWYDEYGAFIPDKNYAAAVKKVTLTVKHETAVAFELADSVKVDELGYVWDVYSGAEKSIAYTIKGGRADEPDKDLKQYSMIAYAQISDEDVAYNAYMGAIPEEKELYKAKLLPSILSYNGTDEEKLELKKERVSKMKFRDTKPSNAGYYVIRITLNEALCNYTTEVYLCFRINKIELDVEIEDYVCDYQYESAPFVTASQNKRVVSVQFDYTYYYYNTEYGNNIVNMAVDKNKVPAVADSMRLATGNPINAGQYVVKAVVNDANYSGQGYGYYTISKVSTGNARLNVLWPNISNSPVEPSVNLTYGQPLKDIGIDNSFTVKYTYVTYITSTRTSTSANIVEGYMMMVTEEYNTWTARMRKEAQAKAEEQNIPVEEIELDLSKEAYINYMNNYKDAHYSRDKYEWYLCFVATSKDKDNFDFVYQPVNIYVGLAEIDWSMVKISDIVYGTEISDISDIEINEKLGILYSTKGAIPERMSADEYYVTSDNYVYTYVQDKYVYSLSLNTPTIYNAGITNIAVKAEFFGVNKSSYPENASNSCGLTVIKKPVDINFVYDTGENAYYEEYNVLTEEDLYYINGIRPDTASSKEIYYTGLRIKYQSDNTYENLPITEFSGKFIFVNKSTDKEYYSTNGIPAGTYDAKYILEHANYSGETEFTLVIEKANLRIEKGGYPTIADEVNTVYYDNNVNNVIFTGGNVISILGGESVSGEFTVVAIETLKFGAANTLIDIKFIFTPSDSANYNIMRGAISKKINRANISNYMSLKAGANYEYKDITFDGDNVNLLKDKFIYEVTGIYAEACGNLDWNLIITDTKGVIPANGYLSAGKYIATVRLVEDANNTNYTGTTSIEFNISQRKAYVQLSDSAEYLYYYNEMLGVKKPFTNTALSVMAQAYDVQTGERIESGVKITFKKNDVTLLVNPMEIGYYDCYITVASKDYELVDADNYKKNIESLHTFLMVSVNVNEIEIINANQIYTVQKTVKAALGYNNAKCTISFANTVFPYEEYKELPVNAGVYDIILTFASIENNGYEERITMSDYDSNVVLTIDKYTAEIVVNKNIVTSYTGKESDKISAYTVPNNLALRYWYRAVGTEVWYSVNPVNNDENPNNDDTESDAYYKKQLGKLDSGEYEIKIAINDNNYKGETQISYLVQKASLSVSTAPVFGSYKYNTDDMPEVVEIENTGIINCPISGETGIKGTFSLNINEIKTLNAGTHRVGFTFMPNSNNYKEVMGECEIVIEKQILPDDFFTVKQLAYGNYAVEYDRTKHSLDVSYDSTKIYDRANSNSDFTVRMTYNGGSAPSAIGYYSIKVEVTSKNYSYSHTWDNNHRLIISKGIPSIKTIPHAEGTYAVGDTLTSVSGGQAVIKTTGNTIDGDFDVITDTTFEKANINKVKIRFTPIDLDNFYTYDFEIDVKVIGKDSLAINGNELESGKTICDSDWTDENLVATSLVMFPVFVPVDDSLAVTANIADGHGVKIKVSPTSEGTLYYGATLADYKVEFVCAHEDCEECSKVLSTVNKTGVLRFENDNGYVPSVNEKIAVVYKLSSGTVENFDIYNNMRGYVSFAGILNKATINNINSSFSLYGFEDGTYVLSVYKKGTDYLYMGITMTVTDNEVSSVSVNDANGNPITNVAMLLSSNVEVRIDAIDGEIYETDNKETVTVSMRVSDDGVSGAVSIATTNYTITNVNVNITDYKHVESTDIIVNNTSKAYDGKEITVETLNIEVRNTQLEATEDSCTLKIYDENGNVSDGKAIGAYKIKIYIDDKVNKYYGVTETEFIIAKNDISNTSEKTYIKLAKDKDVYASSTSGIIEAEIDLNLDGIFEKIGSGVEVTLLYKNVKDDDRAYNSINNIGYLEVGEYDIKITIESEEYRGTAVCKYTINAREISMSSQSCEYNYDPRWESGLGVMPNPRTDAAMKFTYTGTSETFVPNFDYTVYYYSETYSKSSVMPLNAGEYTAIVEFSNTNYFVNNNTFKFVIHKKKIDKIEVAPQIAMTSGGNIIYGQKLSELRIDNTNVIVRSSDIIIDGRFIVRKADAEIIPNAGEYNAILVFVPVNSNYAEYEHTMTITVAKAQAVVTFTTASSYYTGTSRHNDIKWTVNADIDIEVTFANIANPTQQVNPINAGIYSINVKSLDNNYEAKVSLTAEGKQPVFTVNKAKIRKIEVPSTAPISVGVSLAKSSLYNGAVYYEGFNDPIEGTFEFMQSAVVFREAGERYVDYRFTPTESSNFAIYTGTVETGTGVAITITKAVIEIVPGSNGTVYGTPAYFELYTEAEGKGLKFETNPSGMENKIVVKTEFTGKTYKTGDLMPSGTYYFTCWLEDDNYTSEITEFKYVVEKKAITIDFTNELGNAVTAYATTYGTLPFVGVKVYDSNTVDPEISTYLQKDADTILSNIVYSYKSRGTTAAYEAFVPPSEIGTYDLTVTLYHDEYTATRTVIYTINKGKVFDISFDTDTLVGQEYGTVVAPIVTTTPANVSYYIVYQGYNNVIPQDVGSYNITVYIDDENFEAKQISAVFKINPRELTITDIIVKNKAYDGVATLQIEGQLSGVLYQDEVQLAMSATTFNNDPSVGEHYVTITECKFTGLHAANYTPVMPTYDGKVKIYNNVVTDKKTGSYIMNNNGFADGTEIKFTEVNTDANKTSVWSKMVGVESSIIAYSVTVNNAEIINDGQYKICIQVPEQYRDVDFKVDFEGDLKNANISYKKEGNYISFYSDTAHGEVVFSVAEFKYEYIVTAAILLIVLIAVIVLLILNPLQHRRRITAKETEKAAVKAIKEDKRR